MKSVTCLLLVVVGLQCSAGAFAAPAVQISLSDVATKVKTADFSVQANAERVYQSKESVQLARMNLLPRLNLWKIVGAIIDWKSIIGVIEDLVPFIVPANWFRVKEQALFRDAEIAGMKSLRGNQILTAKGIFLQAVMDEVLLEAIQKNVEVSKDVLEYTKLQERFGQAPIGTSNAVEIRFLGLQEDARELQKLVIEEKKTLALMVGVDARDEIELKRPPAVDISSVPALNYGALEKIVLDRSPEIKQYDYLYDAARYVKREVQFNLLGTSSMSRGILGGVFDQYPIQPGLGFGMGPSIRIVRSQRDQIKVQQDATKEVLKRQIAILIQNIGSDKDAFATVLKRQDLGRKYFASLNQRLQLGQKVQAIELIDSSKTLIETETAYLTYMMRLEMNIDRVERLKFEGDYLNVDEN